VRKKIRVRRGTGWVGYLLLESGQSEPESAAEENGADDEYTGHFEGCIEDDLGRGGYGGRTRKSGTISGSCRREERKSVAVSVVVVVLDSVQSVH